MTKGFFDFVIVGGGIAGIAISELLQRSGQDVALIEQNDVVGASASAYQAGWFHTGDLYAALPTHHYTRLLRKNLSYLLNYYSGFDGMNLLVEKGIASKPVERGWFDSNTILFYYVSPFSADLSTWNKIFWQLVLLKIKLDPWFYPRIRRKNFPVIFNNSSIAFLLDGYDRRMDTRNIIVDLLRSFLGHGGTLLLKTTVYNIKRQGVVLTSDGEIKGKHIIVSAGKQSGNLTGISVKTVYSPIAVMYPALTTYNFARMTPIVKNTVNHIYHPLSERLGYSVIGNAVYVSKVTEQEHTKAIKVFANVLHEMFGVLHPFAVYFGHKTEVVKHNQLRNYQSHIIDKECCTVVVPGKFTFAFSLAVNISKKFNIEPIRNIRNLSSVEEVDPLVSYPQHFSIARALQSGTEAT